MMKMRKLSVVAALLGISLATQPTLADGLQPAPASFDPGVTFTGTSSYPFEFVTYRAGVYSQNIYQGTQLVAIFDGSNQANVTSLTVANVQRLETIAFAPVMATATSISFPMLLSTGVNFGPAGNLVTTLSLPNLLTVTGSFGPNAMAALTSLVIPNLVNVGGTFNPNTMAALTTFSFPSLVTVGATFNPGTMASLTTLSFPALATIAGMFNPSAMAALTTINLSAMTSYGSTILVTTGFGAITTVTLGTVGTLKSVGGNVTVTGQAMSQASVDSILVLLASLDGTSGTTAWSSKTVNLSGGTSSAPSATGLIAKTTLQGRSNTVTTN